MGVKSQNLFTTKKNKTSDEKEKNNEKKKNDLSLAENWFNPIVFWIKVNFFLAIKAPLRQSIWKNKFFLLFFVIFSKSNEITPFLSDPIYISRERFLKFDFIIILFFLRDEKNKKLKYLLNQEMFLWNNIFLPHSFAAKNLADFFRVFDDI